MHAYWGESAEENLLQQVSSAAQAHHTDLLNYSDHRFIPVDARFELLSQKPSTSILQHIADAGTYRFRLNYSIKRLNQLEKSPVHAALADSLENQLMHLPSFKPRTIVECATSIQSYLKPLYQLCRVIGCEDLTIKVTLDTLPPASTLLDRCFELSWPLFIDAVGPWLVQLHRLVDKHSSTSAKNIWIYPSIYIGDMFVGKRDMFVLAPERVPKLMPQKYAKMAVECLNYRYILENSPESDFLHDIPSYMTKNHHGRTARMGIITTPDPFANTSDRQYSFTQPKGKRHEVDQENKHFAVYQMFVPINDSYHSLGRECHAVLQPLLRTHLKLIADIFLLMNGPLWMLCREEINTFNGRPSLHQLDPINQYIHTIAPPCVQIVLQMNAELISYPSDNLTAEYSPPAMLETIITRPLIASLNSAFSVLLQLQQELIESPTQVHQLSIYSTALKHHVVQLERVIESNFTFTQVVGAFTQLQHAILECLSTKAPI